MGMSHTRVEKYIKDNIKRDVVVVGACTGTDAHSVGIDAILDAKGFAGNIGLEMYEGIRAYNLGAQVPNKDLIAKAIDLKADAILVSQVVTRRDIHIQNLIDLVYLLEKEGIRDRIVLLCGGPRISDDLARELGYDAGFGPGTFAKDVGEFIVKEIVKRDLI